MKRWKITIEYNGADYAGWQRQDNVPTIQDEIQKAIYKFCQQDIGIVGASRTDAGVHALGQVAHFDLDYGDRDISGYELAKAINAHLRPQPISVIKAQEVVSDYHARFSAHKKLYMYRLINRPSFLTLDRGRAWHFKRKLDIDAMIDAADIFLGEHDFSSFRAAECQAKSPIRTIDTLSFTTLPSGNGTEIQMYIEGQAFLHHMVRNIMGTLTLVGEGKWSKQDVAQALKAKDRAAGGVTAPPDGLYLMHIHY
ncbi:MAG: tRNA pseudouridine(38-40) synthase TruA [Alphaproteobacteria bacterium]|nr:tRNA pseudouridine(38-40) synthase TruA [Alphaproteobacteria bacterium]NCQ88399.1 tRNA pseudouridine(38-40) synthase TruA [Alphaproteobacteria bacterium]NCT05941.1 tRNA pseudouridine(38-40) synthase TruA [Alphaproteobacteria bacterium]